MRSNANALVQHSARSSRAQEHPGAEVLLAFAQERLLPNESTEVLTHLARCADCRGALRTATAARPEPVPVAAPASPAMPVLVSPPRARRKIWLHLLDSAVGLIAIGSIVLIYHHRTAAASAVEPAPVVPVVQKPVAVAPHAGAPAHAAAPAAVAKPVQATSAPAAAPDSGQNAVVAAAHIEAQKTQPEAQKTSEEAKPAVAVKPPDAASTKVKTAVATPPAAIAVSQKPPALQAKAEPLPQAPEAASAAAIGLGSAGAQTVASAPIVRPQPVSPPVRLQWRVSGESGLVERSSGDGVWREMPGTGATRMRVVSAVGGTIWAGGDTLQLYRSADGGAEWTQVELPPKDGASGAIRRIRFQSALSGTVEADDGSAWTTTDGGLTWK